MASLTDLQRMIRQLDELSDAEETAKAAVRSLRMRRGMKAKRVQTVASQLGVSVLEVRAGMGDLLPESDPEVAGEPCADCDGRGGDGLCSCGGTGWSEDA